MEPNADTIVCNISLFHFDVVAAFYEIYFDNTSKCGISQLDAIILIDELVTKH